MTAKKRAPRVKNPPPVVPSPDDPTAIYVRVPVSADVARAVTSHGRTAIDLAHGLVALARGFEDIIVQASRAGAALEADVKRLTNPRARRRRHRR